MIDNKYIAIALGFGLGFLAGALVTMILERI
jgi:uncharacterized protein involved in exopolysaccharide biosynthesis